MAPLTDRQQQAQAIAAELHKLGVAVICALPLRSDQNLRFQVLDEQRGSVLEKVSLWGWFPVLCGTVPRFTTKGAVPASVYEIAIEQERPVVVDDRSIPRYEIVSERGHAEIEAYRRLKLT
jgi:hypothetical protein